jgi:N-acetylmuramoyl-L-alanine amidase-like protein/LysM domain-containing protein/putative peptidoglycan binding protein
MGDTMTSGDAERVAVDGLGDCDLDDAFDVADPPPGEGTRGGRMLTDLADVLRGAGLSVEEVDGWQFRARGGAGYASSGPVAIIVHHTASGPGNDGPGDVQRLTFDCDVKPMSNLYLDRSGRWWVCAAGATNTNGKGGPLGPLPKDSANSRVIGIEAGNNGVGEPWPDVMQDSYVLGVAAMAAAYGIAPAHVYAHHEWAPSRKIDPAGPSRFGSVNPNQSWDMTRFRAAVAERGGTTVPPAPVDEPVPPIPTGATYVVRSGDSWWSIAAAVLGDPALTWAALAAANGGAERVLHPGDVLTVPDHGGGPSPEVGGLVPPFPGEAREGDHGAVVRAWQEALIAAGVISDRPANRDGRFGSGTAGAVRRLQASWGWSNADGVAGPHTWSRLHGGR